MENYDVHKLIGSGVRPPPSPKASLHLGGSARQTVFNRHAYFVSAQRHFHDRRDTFRRLHAASERLTLPRPTLVLLSPSNFEQTYGKVYGATRKSDGLRCVVKQIPLGKAVQVDNLTSA